MSELSNRESWHVRGFQTELACQEFSERVGMSGVFKQRELACQGFSNRESWQVSGLKKRESWHVRDFQTERVGTPRDQAVMTTAQVTHHVTRKS